MPILHALLRAHEEVGGYRQHQRGQALQIPHGPSGAGLWKPVQVCVSDACKRHHHLQPMLPHALECRDVHGAFALEAGASVRAGAPLRRHLQAQWPTDRDGKLALPGARADAVRVYLWYGSSEDQPVITLRPIELHEIRM